MPEVTNNTPRLLAAAKEFNIGKETLIDFLANKGYSTDGFGSPNARLTAEMYAALQSEFQQDKANKRKSDQIALPKGSVLDAMKKKEKEAAEAAAASKKKEAKEEPAPAIETPTPPPQAEKPKQEPAPEPKPVVVAQQPVAPPTPPPVVTPQETAPPPAAEVTKTETPRLNGPKVVATIDLNALQGKKPAARKEEPVEEKAPPKAQEPVAKPETTVPEAKEVKEIKEVKEEKPAPVAEKPEEKAPPREEPPVVVETPKAPEKPVVVQQQRPPTPPPAKEEQPQEKPAPKETAPVKAPEPVAAKKEEPAAPQQQQQQRPQPQPQQPPVQAEKPAAQAPDAEPSQEDNDNSNAVIENIQAEKLTGPKVIGKINLPVQQDRRDNKGNFNRNNNNNNDEKRKRKRIIVEKKPEPIQPKEFSKDDKREGAPAPANRTGDNNNNRFGNRQGDNRQHGGNRDGNRGPGQGQGGSRPHQPHPGASRPHAAPNRGPGQGGNRGPGQGGGNRGPGNRDNNRQGFNRDRDKRPEDKEIDKNEIQNKIKETMAKLGGGGRGKNIKAKQRRDKRHELAEQMANQNAENNKLQVTEFISVSELANLMDVSFAEVISKCMSLGIMVSINQRLDAEVIELVAGEFGYEVEFIGIDDVDTEEEEEEVDAEEDLQPRAPIVTIMGHVDHGKTSLLDYIRSANVVAGEAGGITQHIGAYQVTTATGKKITFLDTPGHEAFTAMRARGAKAADIAVIVVAADDAIMPQTREAISHSQAAGLPMVFAINKIDKEGANPEKIKEQLAGMNLLVEDWGGKYQSQEISAKNGLNIDVLLEKILLEAELLELKANPGREASGSIIEASLDKGRGYVASVLVQNGTLRQGDTIVSGAYYGKIKAMFNERGQRIDEAGPSSPVQLLGLNGAPQAGEKFKMYEDEADAKDVANRRAQIVREQGIRTKKHITLDEIGRRLALGNFKQLNIIIKGDFDGSVEALSDSLQKLSTEEIAISVVHKAVGQITESDVLLATASDAIIVGFQVRPSSQAAKLAEKENIEIRAYSIIYDAIEELKSAMEGMLEPKIEKRVVANVEVRETYRFDKVTVAGCFVLDGKLARNTRVNLVRDGIVIYTGELGSLKRYKDDVKEVVSNMECGLSIRNYSDLKVGDIVEGFEEVEVKRTL
ncbi:translation initiation factor IF-2 [Chitinophaga agrisoli]|uniref:Translation initiation factor IF-2 n=1 Tax=Chitinophaga agrisoli TaxID=2607653 RepID=A0A5B2W1I9_9BACT|nr:translation initiation factor IF-2 [Chitinophaga agrisoli]KAA2244924.1 translation initiation factor IF-2 [Chitinophaga agrisoli]